MALLTGLTQNPMFNVGAGLLSSAYNPVNPWGGVQSGLLAAQQGRAQHQLGQFREMQMQQMQQQEVARRIAAAREAAAEQQRAQYLAELEKTDPQKAAMIRAFPNMAADVLKQNPQFGEPETMELPDGRKVLVQTDPKTGKRSVLGGGGVTVNVGPESKPLGADATKWTHPETGESPSALMTMEQAAAGGFRLKSDKEQKKEARSATIEADKEELQRKLDQAQAEYEKAKAAFESQPGAANKRKFDNAAAALQTAIAGMENWRGEPSEGVAGRFNVPGALGTAVEKGIDKFLAPEEKTTVNWDEL